MQRLNSGAPKDAQKLFQQVLSYLKKHQGDEIHVLIGLTLNNLSCSYKRTGDIEEAQKCLKKALDLQEKFPAPEEEMPSFKAPTDDKDTEFKFDRSPDKRETTFGEEDANEKIFSHSPRQNKKNEFAVTELNMCAIYSQKGDHMKAKMYAHSSIYKLKQDLSYCLEQQNKMPTISDELDDKIREIQSTLAIANYNLGCQQEHLKEWGKAMESYKNAVQLEKAKAPDGKNQLLSEFMRSYKDVKRKSLNTSK